MSKMQRLIDKAARYEIPLLPSDFGDEDGVLTIDGMEAAEWVDAMTMD